MTVQTDLPSSNPGKDTDVLTDVCAPLLHHPVAACPYQKNLNTAEMTGVQVEHNNMTTVKTITTI
jgi:hypothetical protein